jgi:hypothetical protein
MIPAMLATFALVAAACGGGGGGGTGSDEDYVKALCKAFSNFDERTEAAQSDADEIMADTDNVAQALEDVLKLMSEPFSDFADELDKANPPADMKEAHDGLVDTLKVLAKQLEDGDLAALEESGDAFASFEPSQDIQDRIEGVAENIPECSDSEIFS